MKGINIAFLAYSWDFIGSVNATKNHFGTAPLKTDIIRDDILGIKELADIIIVSLHLGYEREQYPLPSQRNLAHKIIDLGGNIVIGHHPHVLQGIEYYKNGVIAYSLGNFVFSTASYFKAWKNMEKETIILKYEISKKGIEKVDIIPVHANDSFQPVMLKNEKKKEKLSKPFQNKNYISFWKKNRVRKDLPDIYKLQICNVIIYKLYKSKIGRLILKYI
jgi:poly-gamma-glutamate synthesis protein (capsule biosynthesis protein)